TVEVKLMGAAESMNSDMELGERIADVCENNLGMKVSENLTIKMAGSEDFAYMSNRVQKNGGKASFMRIRSPYAAKAHNRKFDFDESYLAKAVKIFCGMAYDIMK
ncbi:MAG: amidohydrolase, partial [Oscillospiraceae bacterium]|nr:amidohydrolase [Oscillospiraceae bacterium]